MNPSIVVRPHGLEPAGTGDINLMSLPNQIAAYSDCESLYAAAARDRRGAQARFRTFGDANNFRMRLNHYRVLLRKESCRVFQLTDPQFNRSEYDAFVNRIVHDEDTDEYLVRVERYATTLAIEALSGDDPDIEFEAAP